jgi:pepF/M3 family oligoendopeptidase
MSYPINWDMESVFKGGSNSPELQQKMETIQSQIEEFGQKVQDWSPEKDAPGYEDLAAIFNLRETIENGLSESMTFSRGLLSADVNDKTAAANATKLSTIASEMGNFITVLIKKFVAMPDDQWSELLSIDPFRSSAFPLNEQRDQGQELLSEGEEAIINALSNDGFKGWGNMYNSLVATIQVPIEEDGQVNYYSAGQAANKMDAAKDLETKHAILASWEETWAEKAPLFADTLNHLAGFRLSNYKAHGVDDFMKRPLEYNRLRKETLDTMWETINKNKPKVVAYLNRKAELLGAKEGLAWSDITADVTLGDYQPQEFSYDEAAEFILSNFSSFSGKMTELAKQAFEEGWIEAEDRPGKRPGGYCANLPESEQSRIFMTFSGTPDNVSTLAHEIGHAFHSAVMRDLPSLNRRYAMNVAETASTFAEMVISDATVREAKSEEEKINLLDNKNSRAAIMFMNIHARYIFETNFYKERKEGIVNDERLSELMVEAQKEAFQDSLSTYHPTFWASKLHFYNTGVPFYNFPYTFGFLFSLGIYARSLEEGKDFEDKYIALLRDTASMTTEELAMKHLDVDLTKPDFWQAAIDIVHGDIDEYLEITEKYV